ncbi:MAG: hypothetical protein LBL31_00440 [Spirochaetaceae bacterium]|jgi:hypothetical protein|nr:hypothetical protein [Spirochaetaceae bacterium]
MSKFDVLNLHYQESKHRLTTEEEGTITLCVANTGDTDFVFSNAELLGADLIPGIDLVPEEAAKADVIYFYYDYSDAEQSLTNENFRDSIAVSSKDTQFSIASDISPTVQRYFKIFSKGKNAVIKSNKTIMFIVNATCSRTPGEAVTIFKYSDDETDHPQRKCFGIDKCPKPVIDEFTIDGTGYKENDRVTFRWTVDYIEEFKFTVRLNNIRVSAGQTSYDLNIACTDYTLSVTNKAGYVSSKTIHPDFGIIFEPVTVESQSSVTLRWDVSRLYNPEVRITRGDTGESRVFLQPSASVIFDKITTDVVFRLDCKIYDKEISVTCPKIISFDVSRTPFPAGREFIPPEEVAKNEIILVLLPYASPNPPGPKPPPPPVYHAYAKWEMCGDYCTVNGWRCEDHKSQCTLTSYSQITSVEFRAYSNCGLYVSQTKNI